MSDKYQKQREFEAWLAEVKKAPSAVNGAPWEVCTDNTRKEGDRAACALSLRGFLFR